jgi:hypothetical protein
LLHFNLSLASLQEVYLPADLVMLIHALFVVLVIGGSWDKFQEMQPRTLEYFTIAILCDVRRGTREPAIHAGLQLG